MLNLIQIKQRINAIKSTQKVVEAMRLISISAYPKIHQQHFTAINFVESAGKILNFLLETENACEFNRLSQQKHHKCKTLIIVISSGKGLCGAFNSQLELHAKKRLDLDPEGHYEFLAIGKQAETIISNLDIKIINFKTITFDNLSIHNITKQTNAIKKYILDDPHIQDVICLSNVFKTLFLQRPQIRTILPLKNSSFCGINSPTKTTSFQELIWEQPAEEILEQSFSNYLEATIYSLLQESILCENAARFITTDSAAQNAKNKIEILSHQYNKYRQGSITREIAELSATM